MLWHVHSERVHWNEAIQTFVEPYLWQSIISEIHWLWMSSSFSKFLKFDEEFKNWHKNRETVFSFLDNCICYSTCRFQIKQTEYLWSAVYVLIKTCTISNNNKREVSQVRFAQSEKEIW